MYIPIWIIIIGVVIYFFWFRKNKKENHIKEKTNSKFVGRHQQACAVKKLLGQNIPEMEMQIASNKDFRERKQLDESLKELEEYVSSELFGSMEEFAKLDIKMSFDSVAKLSEVGYDTCVFQNDRKMEERLLTIFVNLSEYIKKIVSENNETIISEWRDAGFLISGKEFTATDDLLNSAVVIGTMKFISLGGLLKTDEEKNAWIILSSLENPERHFGHFNKSNLIKISLTTIKKEGVNDVVNKLKEIVKVLLKSNAIDTSEESKINKMIESGLEESEKLHKAHPASF